MKGLPPTPPAGRNSDVFRLSLLRHWEHSWRWNISEFRWRVVGPTSPCYGRSSSVDRSNLIKLKSISLHLVRSINFSVAWEETMKSFLYWRSFLWWRECPQLRHHCRVHLHEIRHYLVWELTKKTIRTYSSLPFPLKINKKRGGESQRSTIQN